MENLNEKLINILKAKTENFHSGKLYRRNASDAYNAGCRSVGRF